MTKITVLFFAILLASTHFLTGQGIGTTEFIRFEAQVIDANSNVPIPARIYIRDENGTFHFVRSASSVGSAWPYTEEWVKMPDSIEQHTTISAHPFFANLPKGKYEIEIERGKEYIPLRQTITIDAQVSSKENRHTFRLKRWSDVSKKGWYSGETHVHRRIAELPNVMLAEELNVTFPVTYWTIRSDRLPDLAPSPLRSDGPSPFGPREDIGYEPIEVAENYIIFPRNTEYEIFTVGDKRHVLGALFILNHREPFMITAPPIHPIAEQAKAEGALLDLDKHNWPWSLMLIPVAKVDLYELSNNSVWRTNFGFKQAGMPLPSWAPIEQESPGVLTEWGWLQFGFEMYYALLNCGVRLSPTAGTASGVHPVPLGYSRVYVHTGSPFSTDSWLAGLKQGRSFVTTGPMLMANIEQQLPGHEFKSESKQSQSVAWNCEVESLTPITKIEWIINGKVHTSFEPTLQKTELGTYRFEGEGNLKIGESGWAIVRTWSEQSDGRKRFAHSAPWYFSLANEPIRPPIVQLDYLIGQIETALQQQQGVLQPEAMAEFIEARNFYRSLHAKRE